MATYLFSYRTPKDYTSSADAMIAWDVWFASMAPDLVDRSNPIFANPTRGNCDANTALGGYSLVAADDLEAAVAAATGCPFLALGGGVGVGELTLLNRSTRLIVAKTPPAHTPVTAR